MPLFSWKKENHSESLLRAINSVFRSKVRRGMRVRIVGERQIVLEDVDEWLHIDTKSLCSQYKHRLAFDFYATICRDTSISGLCVSISIAPFSSLWLVAEYVLAVFTCMTAMCWGLVLHEKYAYV
tara:strand:+ start:262 stop:636 length:375 start_codon:yes stop_codon:yes gene_type:complete